MTPFEIVSVVSGFSSTLVLGAVGWTNVKNDIKNNSDKQKEQKEQHERDQITYQKNVNDTLNEFKRQIDKMWEWKDEHDKEEDNSHRKLDQDITVLKVMSASSTAQNQEILRRLESIEVMIKELFKKN